MKSYAVLSAVGPDRTGLVADLSAFLLACGANVEESRMAVLGGDFAVILLFSVEDEAFRAIEGGVEALSARTGLSVILRKTRHEIALEQPSLVWRIRAVAMDHPGIVHRLAQAVADRSFNILELSSQTTPAPVSGTPVFSMEMTVAVPAGENPTVLRAELVRLGAEEGVDIEVHPLR
jgi:glycine cleavage system transcriptional repressor